MKRDVKCLTFSTQSGPAISVYIVFKTDTNVVFDKMLAATQGLLWLVLVAVSSASGKCKCQMSNFKRQNSTPASNLEKLTEC